MTEDDIWIGIVHVRPSKKGSALGPNRAGAFVHVVAQAGGAEAYRAEVINSFEDLGLAVVEFDDVNTVRKYRLDGRISNEIEEIIDDIKSGSRIQFGVFDAYGASDD